MFLYQVTPNTSQRNNDLPTRAADGTLVKRPVAALDLHFLITAYGDETELVGQRLIGSVVRALHEIPVLPKDIIELAGERPYLAGSDLAESAQRVRFTPTVMDVDETSKLWGMLYQTPYTLSVVYQAALVLIDGRETPVAGKPVERPEVRVLPFGAPGAPVPPGAEPTPDVTSNEPPPGDVVKQETEAPGPPERQEDSQDPCEDRREIPGQGPGTHAQDSAPGRRKPGTGVTTAWRTTGRQVRAWGRTRQNAGGRARPGGATLTAEIRRVLARVDAHAGTSVTGRRRRRCARGTAELADRAPAGPGTAPLDALVSCFSLTPFERDLVLLAAAHELEPTAAARCAAASGDPERTYPTFSLALAALAEPHWSALTPVAPLQALADRRAGRRVPADHLPAAARRAHPAFPAGLALSGRPAARPVAPHPGACRS